MTGSSVRTVLMVCRIVLKTAICSVMRQHPPSPRQKAKTNIQGRDCPCNVSLHQSIVNDNPATKVRAIRCSSPGSLGEGSVRTSGGLVGQELGVWPPSLGDPLVTYKHLLWDHMKRGRQLCLPDVACVLLPRVRYTG
jgi:hypothetical protein